MLAEKELLVKNESENAMLVAELTEEINDLKAQLVSAETYIEYLKDTSKRQLRVAQMEQQRISMMLELAQKEQEELQRANSEQMNLKWAEEARRVQCEMEKQKVQEQLQCIEHELSLIKSSRGFKLLNIGFPIKQRIWKLFGKNI